VARGRSAAPVMPRRNLQRIERNLMFDIAFWIVLGIGLVVLLWLAFLRDLDFD
jgi:hypothetical protein